MAEHLKIGIEVGGRHLRIMGLSASGTVAFLHEIPHVRSSYAAMVQEITALITASEETWGVAASIGIAIPGTHVAATGLVKNSNVTEFNGRPLWRDLEVALGKPVRLANDANCFALAEARDGAAVGCEVVFGIILDAGCGGGLVIHGRVLAGYNGLCGEWGHNHLPHSQRADLPELACYCGQFGCIETYLSAPGFTQDYLVASGEARDAKAIATAAAAGEPIALAACRRFQDRLARSLAGVINILDPDCIVVGGELAKLPSLYQDAAELWHAYVFGGDTNTRLVGGSLGDASGVRGAAALWDAPSARD